jgi:caspase domain-containing protein
VRYFIWLFAAASCALGALFASPADARRVALVIGNSNYKVAPLENPVNDAAAVAEAIEQRLKFDKVVLKRNLGAEAFREALRELARESRGAEIGVLYFAGHGVEVGGRNFLIPVDAGLKAARDVDLEAIALETALAQLDGVSTLKLVILDACRNNPFPLAGGTRSIGIGLARIEPEGNTLVAYAARHGTMAEDGSGSGHSPFTGALLKHIAMPGLEVRQLFGYVRDEVAATTGHRQQPYLYGSLGGQGLFLQPQTSAPAAIPSGLPQPSEAERAWAAVKDSDSIGQLEVIAGRYRGTVYGDLARARIDELRGRGEAGQKLAAAIPPPASTPVLPLARQIQVELQRVGCAPGEIDGVWGDKAKAGLTRFARHAKLSMPAGEPTLAALEAIKGQSGRVCPLECGPGTVEKDGACVAKPAPGRGAARATAPQPPRRAQPKEEKKPAMCWAVDPRGTTSTLVPCSDPRALTRAY